MNMSNFKSLACVFMSFSSGPLLANEVITYSYDARGRLTEATYASTGPNSGLNIHYQFDLANNRMIQMVTGSTNSGQKVVVVPKGTGFDVIPINP